MKQAWRPLRPALPSESRCNDFHLFLISLRLNRSIKQSDRDAFSTKTNISTISPSRQNLLSAVGSAKQERRRFVTPLYDRNFRRTASDNGMRHSDRTASRMMSPDARSERGGFSGSFHYHHDNGAHRTLQHRERGAERHFVVGRGLDGMEECVRAGVQVQMRRQTSSLSLHS